MKKVRMEKLPKCDLQNLVPAAGCDGIAKYDAPDTNGHWAHMCEAHYKMMAGVGAEQVAFELVEGVAEPVSKDTKPVRGIEPGLDDMDYWENAMFDGIREIECPECGEMRRVEPDAVGIFNCEGCGARVRCPAPIV